MVTLVTPGVRSGSAGCAFALRFRVTMRLGVTPTNGSERVRAVAMQKVVGSSPIIRFE